MLRKWTGYVFGTAGTFLVVILLLPVREYINTTPVALAFLLVVLFTATGHGRYPAFAASILSVLCFNLFFTPPYYTFTVAHFQNWIALAAFLLTALVAGNLSVREKKQADDARAAKREIEHLYSELRKAFEQASEAEAIKNLKSALLDAVTHDLRTPLTTMKAAITTVLDNTSEELDEEGRREMLDVVNMEIDRLNRLLENLIEMAKIEAGAMEPRRAWSTIDEILSIALTRSSGIASRHNIKVEIENDLPPLRVDEKAIAEVLYVLIENSTKYSPPGSDMVITARTATDGNMVQVSVQDQGIGIPSALREKVFDKFFRVSSERSAQTSASGLGMGLAIARGIVEAHKGRIWIDGSYTQGTRVSFVLPLREEQASKRSL